MRWVLAIVVVAAVIGGVLFLPVILGGGHGSAAPAAPDTPIPVGTLGGLALSVVLSARMALARRGGSRRDHD
ncbi:MAG: hypothetical protein JO248_09360 [Acidimicrobiia bacterium]|nr:hypothetical protein [Acidimicrobiia bacterium]